jgi:osmotically-inducible protein OsmY
VHVNVTSYNRMLLLTGEAPTAQEIKADIEKLAAGVPERQVDHQRTGHRRPVELRRPQQRFTYITSKVKARFVDANKFAANHVKVVTEAGVVFLLGIVTQAEANDAVEIARTTGGVQKVVRVFEIISPEQAKALETSPNRATPGRTEQAGATCAYPKRADW